MCWGSPHVRYIPVHILAGQVRAGLGLETIRADYGLTRADVLVACWYAARYGTGGSAADTRRWRQRWGAWADTAAPYGSRGRWDDAEDPPTGVGT